MNELYKILPNDLVYIIEDYDHSQNYENVMNQLKQRVYEAIKWCYGHDDTVPYFSLITRTQYLLILHLTIQSENLPKYIFRYIKQSASDPPYFLRLKHPFQKGGGNKAFDYFLLTGLSQKFN